jgi:hypothetical protein
MRFHDIPAVFMLSLSCAGHAATIPATAEGLLGLYSAADFRITNGACRTARVFRKRSGILRMIWWRCCFGCRLALDVVRQNSAR